MSDKELRILTFAPEVRAGENGKKMIAGYAVKWNQWSNPIMGYFRENFQKGAFATSLIQRAGEIFGTWNHNYAEVLGRSPSTLSLREDDIGLYYEIDPPSWAEKYIETIERGDVRGSSFTFIATKVTNDFESDPKYILRTVHSADLYEVAPVTIPAYPQSTAGVRSEQDVVDMLRQEKARREQTKRAYLERNRALRAISIDR